MTQGSKTAVDARRSLGDRFEESLIAMLLGAMTLVTFANVVARFLDFNILWALETTVFLFAWLVLLGASYAVKRNFHIGVDIFVRLLPKALQRSATLLAVALCVIFSVLLLKGSWDYWWPFASTRTFYEVNDIPMPGFLQFVSTLVNEGERYEKMPRFIPYVVLPISTLLLTIRFLQVGLRVWRGEQELIIESHEIEDIEAQVEDVAGGNPDDIARQLNPGVNAGVTQAATQAATQTATQTATGAATRAATQTTTKASTQATSRVTRATRPKKGR